MDIPGIVIWGTDWPAQVQRCLECFPHQYVTEFDTTSLESSLDPRGLFKDQSQHVYVVHPDSKESFSYWSNAHAGPEAQEIYSHTFYVLSGSESLFLSCDSGYRLAGLGHENFILWLQGLYCEVLQKRAFSLILYRQNKLIENHKTQIELQDELLQMAVHDLRSPISAMICYSELLMDGVLDAVPGSPGNPLQIIHQNCQYLMDLITDFLDSAQLESGKTSLSLSKVALGQLVEKVSHSLGGLAKVKDVSIEHNLSPLPDLYVNEQKIERVLLNLLANAIKFTKKGGKIWIRTSAQDNDAIVAIKDSGPGIPVEDQAGIFEKFNVGDKSVIQGKGHGLGLAIAKKFVELHGGKIFVESVRLKGSTFILHLPIEKRLVRQKTVNRALLILDPAAELDSALFAAKLGFPCYSYSHFGALNKELGEENYRGILLAPSALFAFLQNPLINQTHPSLHHPLPLIAVVKKEMGGIEALLKLYGLRILNFDLSDEEKIDKLFTLVNSERRTRF